MASQAEAQGWAQQDERRMLRAVYRVEDVDASVEYYKKHFGMQLLRQDGEGRAAVLGYGAEAEKFALELTSSGDGGACDLGKGFGHFGLVVEDAYQTCDNIKAEGGKVTREAGPVKGGKTVIAFVEDPTGYKWELLQRPASPEPICQVMLRVADLDKSIKWYQDVLGMQLIRKRENEAYKYTLAFMGYGPEESSMVFELTYNWGTDEPYEKGNAYSHVAIGTQVPLSPRFDAPGTDDGAGASLVGGKFRDEFRHCHNDCSKTLKQIKECGGEVIGEPDSTSLTCLDPDGYKVVFVNSADLL